MMRDDSAPNPYVGLRPFESEDTLYYFGRNEQTKALLRQLQKCRFLAVVGSSGCGKSSLVRAGLIPHLQAGFLVQDRDLWRVGRMKPGDSPLRNLSAALAEAGAETEPAPKVPILEEEILTGGAAALLEDLRPRLARTDSNLLILVDQFEELFRYARPEDRPERREEAADFVQLLLDLAEQPDAPIYVCLTMRSDFLGDCDAYYGLPEAMNRGQYLVPRLTRAQRREAITGPARLSGAEIAPRLVDRLLNENIGTRDDLPVLQHALLRTWERWREAGGEGPVDLSHYEHESVGTIQQALHLHAEQALTELARLDEGYPAIARRLFQGITEIDATNRRIRRPAHLNDLAALAETSPETLWTVIQKFRDNRRNFLVLSSENPSDNPLVDISHESLIRQWHTLTDWVDEEARSARIYRRLDDTAVRWQDKQAELLRGTELQLAADWWEESRPSKPWADRYGANFDLAKTFLGESRRAEKDEAVRKEAQRQKEFQRNRLLAWVMSALFVVSFAAAIGISWWAHRANEQERTARQLLYVANLNLAENALERRNLAAAGQLLGAFLPLRAANPSEDLRSFPWYRLWRKIYKTSSTLSGHADNVDSVTFSPDGRILASGSEDNSVKLWNVTSGKEIATLSGHRGWVYSVVFSPDGRTLATGGWDQMIKLWDVASGKETATLRGHTAAVYSVAFSPDGRSLVSGSRDDTVKLWRVESGKETATLRGHSGWVNAVAFSPDGRSVASGSSDNTVTLWDVASGRESATLAGHTAGVYSVAFSPDGRSLATGSWDNTVKLWDVASGRESATLAGHTDSISSVSFAPDGRTLASGSSDHTVKLWDVASGRAIATLAGHTAGVYSVAFSPDGRNLATGSWDQTVKLWDVARGKETAILSGHAIVVYSVAFSPNGRGLASGSADRTVKLWDLASGKDTATLSGHRGRVYSVAFSPDGRRLASGSEDRAVKLWDAASGRETATLSGHAAGVYSVAFSPDGRTLASGSADHTVKLWDLASGRVIATLSAHSQPVYSVAFSPDGRSLASGGADRTIKLWDVASGKETATLSEDTGEVHAVAFSPDGRQLAAGSEDETIRLWDVATGNETATFSGHRGRVYSVAFSPDGRSLASGSADRTVKLWDLASGKETATLSEDMGEVHAVAFAGDGRTLAGVSGGVVFGTVLLWFGATDEEVAHPRNR